MHDLPRNASEATRFGAQLRRRRQMAGLTQEELAEKSGVSVRAISDIERGYTDQPHYGTLRRIAGALAAPFGADAHSAAPQWPRPAQLPPDLRDFTGRAERVEQLGRLLSKAHEGEALGAAVVVAAITGTGGIGKSALALHVAHQIAPRFEDGQLYLNLRGSGLNPVSPGESLARFLRDLGVDLAQIPADEPERAALYRSRLAGRRVLIVLDDARDAAQVRPLLPGAAGCAVLVTGRESLPDLDGAHQTELDVLDEADAVALFEHIVGSSRTAAEMAAVANVLASCGGLPLAIRIAGARLAVRPTWSIAALADRLADARTRLDELKAGDLAVRATFTISYEHVRAAGVAASLPPDRAFRMLALADGPDISLPAAAALMGTSREQARTSLEILADAHLLQAVAPGRYRLHDLLRAYAAERIQAEDDAQTRNESVRRILLWYLSSAAAACRVINPHRTHVVLGNAEPGTVSLTFHQYADALAWLDAEHQNLLAAVQQASRYGQHELAWKLSSTLWDLFNLRGRIGDWLAAHKTGLASARLISDKAGEKCMLANLAGNYLYLGKPQEALDCVRQILVITCELGDLQGTAIAHVNLGVTLTELGRIEEAARFLHEGLRLARDIGYRNGQAVALCGIAAISGLHARFDDAISHYDEALGILREINNLVGTSECLVEMCTLRLRLGDFDAAIPEAMEAVELSRKMGIRRTEAQALAILGRAYRDCGDPEQAERLLCEAAAILTDLGHTQADNVIADIRALSSAGSRSAQQCKSAATTDPTTCIDVQVSKSL